MSRPLPTKVYLVDRTPLDETYGWRNVNPRRLYMLWQHVCLFISANRKRCTFRVYEADVTWREYKVNDEGDVAWEPMEEPH